MVVAARSSAGRWEPLHARYDARAVLPVLRTALAQGVRSFQKLFALLDVEELALSAEERRELVDWDSPEDMEAD
jgi:molybdopterin-guanine dinucleotide biosynthesis protein A